jgi:hypothetical protein
MKAFNSKFRYYFPLINTFWQIFSIIPIPPPVETGGYLQATPDGVRKPEVIHRLLLMECGNRRLFTGNSYRSKKYFMTPISLK